MPNGVKTPDAKVAEFRAEYLCLGNASAAARKVGLNEATGRDYARGFEKDEEFLKARREMHASALQRLVSMRMRVAEVAADRFENNELDVAENADGQVTVIDKRPEYGRLVMDAEKAAHGLAKLEANRTQTEPVTFNVILRDEDDSPPSDNGSE